MKTALIRSSLRLGVNDYKRFYKVLEKSLVKSNLILIIFRIQKEREITRNDIYTIVRTDTIIRLQFPNIVRAINRGDNITTLVYLIYKINGNYRKRYKREE